MRKFGKRHALLGSVLVLVFVLATAAPALAWTWQATYYPFYHSQSFTGTVNSGQEDAAVVYEIGERHVWAEGAYLNWTQSGINSLIAYMYCRDHYCNGPKVWYQGASTYHAFDKNTSNFNNLRYKSGWAWTNLPGASISSEHSDGELRFYIGDPYSMSASATYYSQMVYKDTAYNGSIKTNGQIMYSTYLVQVGSIVPMPTYRDDNAKLCVNNDNASRPNNGVC